METGAAGCSATQLYALRSQRNWGIGDFEDLRASRARRPARPAAAASASIRCTRCIPAIRTRRARTRHPAGSFSTRSTSTSNACPSSPNRRTLAPARRCGLSSEAAALRTADLVDYERVARSSGGRSSCSSPSFRRIIWSAGRRAGRGVSTLHPRQRRSRSSFWRATRRWRNTFARSTACYGWQQWPLEYRSPESTAVAALRARASRARRFLRLRAVARATSSSRSGRRAARARACGIYRDLAVGVELNGADAWADQRTILGGASLGAPPDPLNALGQNWGLPPISPHALRARDYEPFARLLRANMQHAGASAHRSRHGAAALLLDSARRVAARRRVRPLPVRETARHRRPREHAPSLRGSRRRSRHRARRLSRAHAAGARRFRRAWSTSSDRRQTERFNPPASYPRWPPRAWGRTICRRSPAGGRATTSPCARRCAYSRPKTQREAGEDRWAARFTLIDALLDAPAPPATRSRSPARRRRSSGTLAVLDDLSAAVHRFLAETPLASKSSASKTSCPRSMQSMSRGRSNEHPNWGAASETLP